MGKSDRAFARLVRTAEAQSGLFTFRQAVEAGFAKGTISGRVRRGHWLRVAPGVYRVAGSSAPPETPIICAYLAVGEPCAVAGHAAASLWKLIDGVPETVEVLIPVTRRVRSNGVSTKRTRRWSTKEMVKLGGVPITSPMRTLLDLSRDSDELELELALDAAHRLKLVDLRRFDRYLEMAVQKRVRGASRLRTLLALRDPDRPNDSGGETKLTRRLRRAGLPLPVPQVWVDTRAGPRRIDLAYPEQKVALEMDSYTWHHSRVSFDDDRARDSELADLGWERRYLTSTMIDDPAPTLEWTVATALGLRPTRWGPR